MGLQLIHDVRVMFGALKTVFRSGKAKKHLTRHEEDYNGIAAWLGLMTEYDHGGDTEVLVEKYETIVQAKDHRDYPDGISGFVDDYENAFTELSALGESHTDRSKMKVLMRNLNQPQETDWLVCQCQQIHGNQFTEACVWLRSYDAQINHVHLANAKAKGGTGRRTNLVETGDLPSKERPS